MRKQTKDTGPYCPEYDSKGNELHPGDYVSVSNRNRMGKTTSMRGHLARSARALCGDDHSKSALVFVDDDDGQVYSVPSPKRVRLLKRGHRSEDMRDSVNARLDALLSEASIYSGRKDFRLDFEGPDVGVWFAEHQGPNYEIDVYTPVENIGKRGKRVEHYSFRMWDPNRRRAWDMDIKSKLRDGMSFGQVAKIIGDVFREAVDEYEGTDKQVKVYEPVTRKVKGVAEELPERKTAVKYTDVSGRDMTVVYAKSGIRINSDSDSAKAAESRMVHYIEIPWRHVKKVSAIADDIVKGKGLDHAAKLLDRARVRYKEHYYMDPMWR